MRRPRSVRGILHDGTYALQPRNTGRPSWPTACWDADMMKCAALSVVASLAIPLATPAKSNCLSYEPSRVSIQGTLTRVIFPGPPNFQDVARGDKPEPYFVLQVQQPVCVNKGKYEDEPSL